MLVLAAMSRGAGFPTHRVGAVSGVSPYRVHRTVTVLDPKRWWARDCRDRRGHHRRTRVWNVLVAGRSARRDRRGDVQRRRPAARNASISVVS